MSNSYRMSISLNVLNHLGLHLYSNTPAVLAEVIANAWDADATTVKVDFDLQEKTITVTDDGHGMDLDDVNRKYLYVGFKKRTEGAGSTPKGRSPMGRKGIGKLSLFSIANQFEVFSRKEGCPEQSFLMDADALKRAIQSEDPSSPGTYEPEPILFDANIDTHGTSIRIKELKKLRLTQQTISALRKRIARRFGIIGKQYGFQILIDSKEVKVEDRDYFHKARFLFQYGEHDYAQHCNNLDSDEDTGKKLSFTRGSRFDAAGKVDDHGEHEVRGWIAVARRSNDLDDREQRDNLNKITVAVRGKVALEDILNEYRLGGMITKFLYGEINADFLDQDNLDDIATSSRQSIAVDDPRYIALRTFIEGELRHIWNATNRLKERKGLETALASNPHIQEWYESLKPKHLQEPARKIFAVIDRANVDEAHKQDFYANGILAFETQKLNYAIDRLDNIDTANLDLFLKYLGDMDAIEAAKYFEIIQERLAVIKKFRRDVDEDVRERFLQEYVFDHLWLFDPAWERATGYKHMEEQLQGIVGGVPSDSSVRLDIRYRRISGSHVIIELKRASRASNKTDLEEQAKKYISALEKAVAKNPQEAQYPIEAVCLVGTLPIEWNDPKSRKKDEDSLRVWSIRVMSYDELIDNAFSAYSKFIEASDDMDRVRRLINDIRMYQPES